MLPAMPDPSDVLKAPMAPRLARKGNQAMVATARTRSIPVDSEPVLPPKVRTSADRQPAAGRSDQSSFRPKRQR